VISPVISGRPEAGWIVWTPVPGMLNAIVSAPTAALASRMAWRSEPGPELSALMTVNVAAEATAEARDRTSARDDAFRLPPYCKPNVLVMNTAICPRVLVPSGQ
jgi:hypothetical protein